MRNIFDFEDHYSYLNERFSSSNLPRGTKGRFANYVRIQPAFLSQVLRQKYPLSLEQADLANSYFEHTAEESDFFLLLVSRDRANSASLRKHFTRQIQQAHKRRLEIVERLGRKNEISEEAKGTYYSSWIYAAAHVATTIPGLRKLGAIKEYLNVSHDVLLKVLQFLQDHNLITREGDEFLSTQNWIRLDRLSPHIIKLHTNWRQKAIQNFDLQNEHDLHYSG
ncbi:MAG: DUF4423 domain-containing protein, partial [Bacillota bacterium]